MKHVPLNGGVVVIRVKETDQELVGDGHIYKDIVFVRDESEPEQHNVWKQIENYRTFIEIYGGT